MGCGGRVLRVLLGAIFLVNIIWFLLVGILANRATKTTTSITFSSAGHLNLIEQQRFSVHLRRDSDLNYVSKRRVPSGPDPIHNRRAGQYRQPPGRV